MNPINGWASAFSRKTGAGKTAVLTALQVEICKKLLLWGSWDDFCKQNPCSWHIMGVLTSPFFVYEKSGCHLNLGKASRSQTESI